MKSKNPVFLSICSAKFVKDCSRESQDGFGFSTCNGDLLVRFQHLAFLKYD
jgi:hypothetical protein